MSLILSIETSEERCSVALSSASALLAEAIEPEPRSHAAKLAVLIEKVMGEAGVQKNQLNAVAVSAGPGSYTGLRIGVSTAKGICYALSIPLIAVNTLDVLIARAKRSQAINKQLFCPMIDARRMEVYCKVVDEINNEIQEMRSVVVDQSTFSRLLDQHAIVFFGSGAMKCSSIIQHPNAIFIKDILADASDLAPLAFEKWEKNATEELADFEPVYIKEFLIKKSQKEIA